jgi:hypothetical protein
MGLPEVVSPAEWQAAHERRSNAFGLLMSLNMPIETPGGFDFTGVDCRAWMQDAGVVGIK